MQSEDQTNNEERQLEMYQPTQEEPDHSENFVSSRRIHTTGHEPVRWSASEYINESKNGLWFVAFAVVAVGFVAADLLFLKSYTFSALVVVMAITTLVLSRRPPRTINYALSEDQGLYIGDKLHHFDNFKAFGLIRDGEHHSIMLIPIKRFDPGVSVYFPEEVGERIVDILGARLPMEDLKLDFVDILVRKLHL